MVESRIAEMTDFADSVFTSHGQQHRKIENNVQYLSHTEMHVE